jgi:alpha-glucosidase
MRSDADPATDDPMSNLGRVLTGSVFVVLTAMAAGAGCGGCAPPDTAVLAVGDAIVTVDGPQGVVQIARGPEVVWQVHATDVGVSGGGARYVMEFGMFDIREDFDDFEHADALVVTAADEQRVVFEWRAGERPLATGSVTADEHGAVVLTTIAPGASRIVTATSCAPDHHFVGLGAHTHDVDFRGQIVPVWVSEQGIGKSDTNDLPLVWQVLGRRHTTHVAMPAFVRSDGVAAIVDTTAFARFDLCASDVDVAAFEVWDATSVVRIHVADTPLRAQQAMAASLGRPRLLPPYVFAPWNDAIFSEQEVRDFATFLRAEQIPSSVIWSEDWRGGQDAGELYRLDPDWRLDRRLYPTYEDMTADLRAQGFAHQVYFNTFVTQSGDVFDELTAAGHAILQESTGQPFLFSGADREFSPTALLDLTSEGARTRMKEEHLKEALRLGARGWMADYAEWMPVDDVLLASGEDPALVHNRYAVDWARLNREAITEAGLLDEAITFSRSGYLGSPGVVDVLWAGDQRTSFQTDDGLPTVVPMGIGAAVTGFGYYAHDVAGYQSSTNDPATKELFFRWTELGAFTPVMRTHHGTHARFNHNLRSDVDSTVHWRRYAEIHVRLYPYLRALAVAMTDPARAPDVATGVGPLPLWVPQPLLFPGDEPSWRLLDQVFLGPSLLVAPVLAEGATSRTVHVPAGRFARFPLPGAPVDADRTALVGPADVDVAAPLGEIPVFVPAGGIVPMTATPAQTLLEVDDPAIADLSSTTGDRVVVVALGADGRFVEEDGASYTLQSDGTGLPDGVDADGAIVMVGNRSVTGAGVTFTTDGHPATRTLRVVFR